MNLLSRPEDVVYPSVAFRVAAWFWANNAYVIKDNTQSSKDSLNTLADGTFHNYALLTYSLTPNLQKLKSRTQIYEQISQALNHTDVFQRGQGIITLISFQFFDFRPFKLYLLKISFDLINLFICNIIAKSNPLGFFSTNQPINYSY